MTSPCVTCTTLADCSRCAPFGAWLAVTDPDPAPCATCTDAEWLTLSGEATEQVAARLGIKVASLERHLHRHGRADLIRKVLA